MQKAHQPERSSNKNGPLTLEVEAPKVHPLPPVIRIEPASACNLRCTHCPTGTVDIDRGIMKPAVFERAISEVSKHIPPFRAAVLYHGGEPLMNKHFFEMPRALKNAGMPFVKTVSNGMLFRPGTAEQIVSCGLDQIEISLDGTSAGMSDAIRLRSKAALILKNIRAVADTKRIAKSPIKICVSTTQFKPEDDREANAPAWLRVALSDYPEIEFKSTYAMQWPEWSPDDGYSVSPAIAKAKPTSCDLLDDTMTIRSDGTVVACCYDLLGKSNLGNVMSSTIEDIWNGAHREFTERFAAMDYPSPCGSCAHVTGTRYLSEPSGPSAR